VYGFGRFNIFQQQYIEVKSLVRSGAFNFTRVSILSTSRDGSAQDPAAPGGTRENTPSDQRFNQTVAQAC